MGFFSGGTRSGFELDAVLVRVVIVISEGVYEGMKESALFVGLQGPVYRPAHELDRSRIRRKSTAKTA